MTPRTRRPLLLACALLVPLLAAPARQKGPDWSKVYGDWALEISAEGTLVSVAMVAADDQGHPSIKLTEATGMFTDTPATAISFDGETLAYDIAVPSPPDMAVKTWHVEAKVGADGLEGTIVNADLGMSAYVSGKRVKK